MTDVKVQELFRRAVADDDAAAMREGLERMLGLGGYGGLSPEREYLLRRPDFVMEMPQSGERIRGRDALRRLQEVFPAGPPAVTVRRVTGARGVKCPPWRAPQSIQVSDTWCTRCISTAAGRERNPDCGTTPAAATSSGETAPFWVRPNWRQKSRCILFERARRVSSPAQNLRRTHAQA